MAELHIGLVVRGNRTISKIGKKKEAARIIFHNEDPKLVLSLDIKEVFLKGARKHRKRRKHRFDPIPIPPGGSLSFPVESYPVGTTFKYTAQIGTSIPEDPIIIIEK